MRFHKIVKFISILLSVIFLAACSNPADPKLHDANNNIVQLSKLKGKWVIVNYWAEWCAGCMWEVPELNRFYHQEVQDSKNNLVLLGVDMDHPALNVLNASIKKTKIEYPVLQEDPGAAWKLGEITLLPVSFIINPQGKLAKILVGPSTAKILSQTLADLKKAQG